MPAVGAVLHEYDIDLTDYAIGNVVQFMTDRRFARWVMRHIRTPSLVEYLNARSDRNIDAPQVRALLSDVEMDEFVSAFEEGPPGGPWTWVTWVGLHRRYIETIGEVRTELTRQVAEDWSAACAEFVRRLEAEGLALYDGMSIVREWIQRLRGLQLAMCAGEYVPLADHPAAFPPIPPQLTDSNVDPQYAGLQPGQVSDIERMREAIRSHTEGATAKPDTLVLAARISRQRGRRALRWLEQRDEYQGFARLLNNNRPRPRRD